MSKLNVTQLQKVLEDLYKDHIITNQNKSEKEQKNIFYTRSLAAYSVKLLSNASIQESVNSITDGFKDNGIDFVHIDNETKRLIVGQSKWNYEGKKSPELGDVLKFLKGFNELIDCNFENFNDEIKLLKDEIENLISDTSCRLLMVLAYSGSQPVSKEIIDELEKTKKDCNDIIEILDFEILDLGKIYRSIPYVGKGVPINASFQISDYGKIEEPYKALYGKMDAFEIYELYKNFGEFLFEKNLRKFIYDSSINDSVQSTLVENPENFWYFNNGITILCNKFYNSAKSANTRSGKFTLEGMNIVNGAQTVGNIFRAKEKGADISNASVMIKIISLDDCEDETFSAEITKSTNSQNRILSKDFITLDPVHRRLFKEIALYNYKYLYKTGDTTNGDERCFTFETAAIALACANENIRYAMLSKTGVGKLWEDINKPPYSVLFNSKTTGLRVFRSVKIMALVQNELDKLGWYGKLSMHSNRFMLYITFRYLPLEKFDDPDFDFSIYEKSITKNFNVFFKNVKSRMDFLYPGAHVYHFFRNGGKCTDLKNSVLNEITNPFSVSLF